MIARYSLLGVLRGKGKSWLFFLLITALTLLINLGIMVLVTTGDYLDACNEAYTTIATVEYIGPDYPDGLAYDPVLDARLNQYDFTALSSLPGVQHWERTARTLGSVAGYQRADPAMPEKMTAVVILWDVSYIESLDMYSAQIKQCVYARDDRSNTAVFIEPGNYSFESGQTYIAYGEFYHGNTGYTNFRVLPFSGALAADLASRIGPIAPVACDKNGNCTYDPAYDWLAEKLRVTASSFVVWATSDLAALLPFQQQQSYLTAGRSFTPEEYQQQAQVCVISELAAKRSGAGIGDTLTISLTNTDNRPLLDSYWPEKGFAMTAAFTIVGICNETPDGDHNLFIPLTDAINFDEGHAGFTLGQAVIDNQMADVFYRSAVPLMADGMTLTLYDQGYAAVTEPFTAIRSVAVLATAVCLLVGLVVLTLFGYLFVYRQRETAAIMSLLGTGKGRIYTYFILGTGMLAICATAFGGIIAAFSHDKLIHALAAYAQSMAVTDFRYSDSNLSILKILPFTPGIRAYLPAVTGLVISAAALISSLTFTILAIRHRHTRMKKTLKVPRARASTTHVASPVKYALLSIIRGGSRSILLAVVAFMVFMLFGQLTFHAYHNEEQLLTMTVRTQINGRLTDINGKQVGNLVLEPADLASISRTGMLSGLYVSADKPYLYLGISQQAGQEATVISPMPVPGSQFAFETLQAKFARGPRLVFTHAIEKTPEFYYVKNLHMQFLEGYDESDLARPYSGGAPLCLVPDTLMAEQGIHLGDLIRVSLDEPDPDTGYFACLDLLVIGSFRKHGIRDNIYCQMGNELSHALLQGQTFSSAAFTIADTSQLSLFKDSLVSLGFSEANQIRAIRSFIVIEDKLFHSTIGSLVQQIRYTAVLNAVISVLANLIGLVIAWLATAGRRLEVAIMRGLGASSIRTALSLFLENMALGLIGSLAGAVVWLAAGGPVHLEHLTLAGIYALCQAFGILATLALMNRKTALRILTDEDV